MDRTPLQRKQDAAQRAYDKMLMTLLGYDPCRDLRVSDVQFIARMAQTFAFDAFQDAGIEP